MTRTRPLTLTVAAVLAALEGLASVVFSITFLIGFSSKHSALDITGFVFFALLGAALALCGAGLSQLRSWGRSPVVLAQLFMLLFAWEVHRPAVAIPLGVLGLAVLVCLFVPASLAALTPDEDSL